MTLSKDHGIASEESMLKFIKEMERAGNDDASSSSFEFSILGALIAPAVEKYLRCHVLGYCYRSFSILRKTCKALHWLLSHGAMALIVNCVFVSESGRRKSSNCLHRALIFALMHGQQKCPVDPSFHHAIIV